jgi:hypothetical protein
MKKITLIIFLFVSNLVSGQVDWQLPMVKDKIVFEFNSPIIEGKTDLCEIYTSQNYYAKVYEKCFALNENSTTDGNPNEVIGILRKHVNTSILPTLYGANYAVGSEDRYAPKCLKDKPDTLIGSINLTLETTKFFSGYKGGYITCVYRIILLNDQINVKFKGFEIITPKYSNFSSQSLDTETHPLEEQYKNMQTKKSEQEYWSDFKTIISAYYKILESELILKRAALNFED